MVWMQPSLHLPLLSILILLTTSTSDDEFFRAGLGTLGTHYNLKKGFPYIQCEGWNGTKVEPTTECGPQETQGQSGSFFWKKLGCNGVFRIDNFERFLSMDTDGYVLKPSEYTREVGGCWHGTEEVHDQCEKQDECVAIVPKKPVKKAAFAFCCCTTHNCNAKVTVRFAYPNNTEPGDLLNATVSATTVSSPVSSLSSADYSIWWIFLSVLLVLILLISCLLCYCRRTRAKACLRMLHGGDQVAAVQKGDEVPLVSMENGGRRRNNLKEGLTLAEVIAEGKLSIVQKGTYKDPDTGKERIVAVKTVKEQKSFLLEEAVYRVCQNAHDHLVHFYGSNFEPETSLYYVVMEHHENGCLESYLKSSTFTPLEALSFLSSLMDGLAFLHSPSNLPSGGYKSAIVHRDIKSRNVIVKSDRTAAIADFGLAMICEGNRPYGRHYQVGTHRYMSPELLYGEANLNMDGLRMADVYAISLIIWEMLNRTLIDEEDEVQPAELPYTTELDEAVAAGEAEFNKTRVSPREEFQRKSIQIYLKNIVHKENRRPMMRERLKGHPITAELVRTTLDMWDFEVDGRISAACAHARLHQLKKDAINGTIPTLS
ncbi:hypothetical protein PENTCL1PPCAC_10614 [Pristionchus entomophagus]|uniref:Serine/threonine-protein kinase receptor n=1 Tax=Pristionchus entomophagus TaxID=358040 RepID=A0AAV5T4C8_9BILA|nr:hypothetical protein PENTCL1PPCAC_10614 [Pristionchus entomophagus]